MTEVYGQDLPDDAIITARFRSSVNYWKNRNRFINDIRRACEGLNEIEQPVSTQYKVKVLHVYILASLINEKVSRYMSQPLIQVIPNDDIDDEDHDRSTRIEQAINVGNYEIERRADAGCWDRVVIDAVLLDEGVEKILNASQTVWSELVAREKSGNPMSSKERSDYKKAMGNPLVKEYVPLEYFFPTYDGPKLKEAFEATERSVLSVATDDMFAGSEALKQLPNMASDGGTSRMVNIIEYVNDNWHAYYLSSYNPNSKQQWPRINPMTNGYTGNLKLLYKYEHGLNHNLYNCVPGRFGGWKTNNNRIEGVGKAMLELSQAVDEIASQVFTNVRAKYWPSLNFKMDPEKRGFGVGGTKPTAPSVKEGEPIVTFVGEEILPIFKPEEDPMVMWLFDQVQTQIGRIGGSSVLFGGKDPGVDTGYHQALQTTSAESLDAKIEEHISIGATNEVLLEILHYKKLNEDIWMHYAEVNPATGRKVGHYIVLDPTDLTPIPRLDVQVRKQRPIDYVAALAAAKQASDDREGKGPLLSDDTIATDILSIQAPDIEKKKIIIESQKREIINSGVLSSLISERTNIKVAKSGIPNVNPAMMQKADPQLLAAIQQGAPGTTQTGGLSPQLLGDNATAMGSAGLPPGPVAGNPELANRVGEAAQGAIQTGAPSI